MQTHTIEGGGGLKVHVRDWGDAGAPAIVFIHGWSQHHMCWGGQTDSALASGFRLIAMDLRGHGHSEAPLAPEAYTNGALWADDINNIFDELNLQQALLVGWSYGGVIIGDYLRRHGDARIAGVNFVGAAIGIGPAWFGNHIGPDFLHYAPLACSEDQAVALNALRDFLHVAIKKPVAPAMTELAMGWSMLVHPHVRAHLISRDDDFTEELKRLRKPALISFGDADTVVMPAMARVIAEHAPDSRLSEYAGVGHAPFLEEPARFNAELEAFAKEAFAAA